MTQTGFHSEVGVTVGWPSCDIGLFDVIFGEGLDGQGCVTRYQGYGYGMDLPFWSKDMLLFLNQEYPLIEDTCHTTENPKFCLTEDAFPVEEEIDADADGDEDPEAKPVAARLRQTTAVKPTTATATTDAEATDAEVETIVVEELKVCAAVLTACDPTRGMKHCINNPDWIDPSTEVPAEEEVTTAVEEPVPAARM